MNTNKLLTKSIGIAAAFLLASSPAKALTANDGDLFLGIRATSGTGSTTAYLVDIGSALNFMSLALQTQTGVVGASQGVYATGSVVNLTGLLSATNPGDLVNTFGANWYTRTDLVYGIVGQDKNATIIGYGNVLFASKAQVPNGTLSTPWDNGSIGQLSGVSNQILAIQQQYVTQTATTFNPKGTLQANSGSTQNDWSYQMPGGNGTTLSTAFTNYVGAPPSIALESVISKGLDLYYQDASGDGAGLPSYTSYIGSFAVLGDGTVQFNSAGPVPEPAAIGLLGSAVLGLVGFARRRGVRPGRA